MRYWWDYMFCASDREYSYRVFGREGIVAKITVGQLTQWAEEEKFMQEHQGDNMSFSNK